MSVLIVLIVVSLVVGLTFLSAFIWSVRSGQYDDTLTPSMRVLLDDSPVAKNFSDLGSDADPLPPAQYNSRSGDSKNIWNEKLL